MRENIYLFLLEISVCVCVCVFRHLDYQTSCLASLDGDCCHGDEHVP